MIPFISTREKKWICWQKFTGPNRALSHRLVKYHGVKWTLGRDILLLVLVCILKTNTEQGLRLIFSPRDYLILHRKHCLRLWGNFSKYHESLGVCHHTNIYQPSGTPIDSPEAICIKLSFHLKYFFPGFTEYNSLNLARQPPFLTRQLQTTGINKVAKAESLTSVSNPETHKQKFLGIEGTFTHYSMFTHYSLWVNVELFPYLQ